MLNPKKCPICYPCITVDYKHFEHQWNQAKTIEDKIYVYFSNIAEELHVKVNDKKRCQAFFLQKEKNSNDVYVNKWTRDERFEEDCR